MNSHLCYTFVQWSIIYNEATTGNVFISCPTSCFNGTSNLYSCSTFCFTGSSALKLFYLLLYRNIYPPESTLPPVVQEPLP